MALSFSMRRRLSHFRDAGLNFDPGQLTEAAGFVVTDVCHRLPSEATGPPTPGGSWDIARGLINDYAFADPATVRAYFDPAAALTGRTMVLRLSTLGVFRTFVGVRILRVTDETRVISGRDVRIWGWTYGTLEGHVESGEMSWETWKWLDSGEVEFHIYALSRPAHIANPFTRIGFAVLEPRERRAFINDAGLRMNRLINRALAGQGSSATPAGERDAASIDAP